MISLARKYIVDSHDDIHIVFLSLDPFPEALSNVSCIRSNPSITYHAQTQEVLEISRWISWGRLKYDFAIADGFVRFKVYHWPVWCCSHNEYYHIGRCWVASVHKCLWKACKLFWFGGLVLPNESQMYSQLQIIPSIKEQEKKNTIKIQT